MRYLIELGEVKERTNWVNAFRVGEWYHELYGKINITAETLNTILANFKANATGHELPIDYQHSTGDPAVPPEENGAAAGWVKDMKVEDGKLFILVEWLEETADKIKKKVYKYFSPTFDTNYTDKETGKDIGHTLLGGALTNTPFLTDLEPVLLSENIKPSRENNKAIIYQLTETKMEELKMELGKLSPEALAIFVEVFDKTEGDPVAKLEEAIKAAKAYVPENKTPEEGKAKPAEEPEMSEEDKAKLSALAKENAELKDKVTAAEVKDVLEKLSAPAGDKQLCLSEAVMKKIKIILSAKAGSKIQLSEKQIFTSPLDAFVSLLDDIKSGGLVTLAERTKLKSTKPDTEIELTAEVMKRHPAGATEDSIKLAEITEKRFALLPKAEQTVAAYKAIQQKAAAELN